METPPTPVTDQAAAEQRVAAHYRGIDARRAAAPESGHERTIAEIMARLSSVIPDKSTDGPS